MNPLARLEQLNLEPTAKTEVAALLQALMDQAAQDAKVIQAKDPAEWLKDTLEKLPAWPNSRIDELLPFTAAD